MTHNANKRRTHNEAARATKQHVASKAGQATGLRRTPYGRRLAGLRAKDGTQDARVLAGPEGEEE